MYNDTINADNKIISETDLIDIFQKMDEEIKKNTKIYEQETFLNKTLLPEYQHWTVKSFESNLKYEINFYDSTRITLDNYNSFLTIFNNRLDEIQDIWVYFRTSYFIENNKETKYVTNRINMRVYENRINIDVELSSDDEKMNNIYELIKEKILHAPERYDRIIKNKSSIITKVGFARGIIPSIIICAILAFIPEIRQIYSMTYVLYPIAVLLFGLTLGTIFFDGEIQNLYKPLTPKQKYAGWDSDKHKSIYKDDIDDYVSNSEIIIGKNINNIKNRKEIEALETKYSKYIPIELGALLLLTIIIIVIGKIF